MAAGDITPARRLPVPESGHIDDVIMGDMQAGDYVGPITGFTADKPAVFFLLPTARTAGVHPAERGVHHVVSPPHVFTELEDGTLQIRESILSGSGWHGYLDGPTWREV